MNGSNTSTPANAVGPVNAAPVFRILLCTNGCETTLPSQEYGVWLAGLLSVQVTLLGVVEAEVERSHVEKVVNETAERLQKHDIRFDVKYDQGRGSVVIARHAASAAYLTVVGPLGRPAWRRMVQGRSFRRLLAKISTPILYVPAVRIPIRHVLLCMGGLGYAFSAERLTRYLARLAIADVTMLYIAEPGSRAYPVAQKIHDHWENILGTDTPQGKNLNLALAELQGAGVNVHFKVRHGETVGEILGEVRGSDYDLIAMGSSYSAQSLRHLYLPNVTAEVAESIHRPVLSVRKGQSLVE